MGRLPSPRLTTIAVLSMGFALAGASTLFAGGKGKITKPRFDPEAERVEFFDGMESGALGVKMIPKNSLKGNLLIENKTDKPLTVELPDAIIGVCVLAQGQGIGGGGGGGGVGGGGGGGGGFFSIPPEKIAKVPYRSVCLEHGKPEPNPRMEYRPVPVEQFTDNPVLGTLLKLLAQGEVDHDATQAAAWHLTDEMSWAELSAKEIKHLGGRPATPYFSADEIRKARSLVARSASIARSEQSEDDAEETESESKPSRVSRTSRTN